MKWAAQGFDIIWAGRTTRRTPCLQAAMPEIHTRVG